MVNRSDTLTLEGAISGAGTLIQAGSGTTILTANNTYAGGTTIAAGTLQIGDGGTSGSVLGDVANSGTLVFDRTDTFTYAGAISGTGALEQAGPGTMILTGANNYAGGTTISAGTLQIGDGGTTGSIAGDVVNNGTLAFDRSDTATFAGLVSGTGALEQAGTGTTLLTGANTYTGGTTISAGTLQLGDGGATGSIVGDVVSSGTLVFDRSDRVVFAGIVSGTGAVAQAGTGTTVLTGENSYAGGTTIGAGTLQLGNGGTSGSIVGDVANSGMLTFNRSDTLTFAGSISGVGAVTQAGGGTTILTGASTYTGGTTISAGTLRVGDGGTAGSIAGDVANSGTLAFDRSDALTFAGIVSGSGALEQAGTGTTILTGVNNYAGGTTISAGMLQLGDGGTTGSIVGDVANNGALAFNRSDAVTFGGAVSGSGALVQGGGGTTTLTAANSYAGPTTVSAGALYINGDQSAATGPTGVAAATLGGIGAIGGDVTIASGGTLAPGDISVAPGTLTVNGGLNLAPGASLAYSFGQANVVGGPFNDLTRVGGDLVLDGTLDVTLAPGGSFDPGVYRVLDYGGTLTNNGLTLGAMPTGDFFVQTAIAQQVNLVNATGLTLDFWDGGAGPKGDGAINGGDGIWQNVGVGDNWTEVSGTVNAPWTPQAFAIFSAAPGTVTIDNGNGQVQASGMQFTSAGYMLQGGALELVGSTASPNAATIRVGDGSSLGADYVATIDAPLTGAVALVKTDLGALILNGDNGHAGTQVNGGTLQVARDASLGAAGLGLDGGTLRTTASFSSTRAVTLGAGNGMFEPAAGTSLTLGGAVGGPGALVKIGAGTLVLAGTNSYAGGTTIASGIVQVSSDANLGAAAGAIEFQGGTLQTSANLTSGRTLDFAGAGTVLTDSGTTFTYNGTLTGDGAFVKDGAGTWLIGSDNSAYAGSGRITGGTLTVDGVLGGTLAVETAGRLEGNGRAANVTNAGVVAPGRGAIGTLTIGNYTGAGGSLEIETVLGDDASPADRLVVTGATAGATRVDVVNLGGTGGPTTEGIKIVDVMGVSNGNFVLNGDYVFEGQQALIAGAFGYRLYKNGVADPADGDWYLRSSLLNPPPTPTPPGPTPPSPPLYQPGVPVYEAYPQILLAMNGLPTLQQRVGNRSWAGPSAQGGAVWGRMESSRDRPQAEFSTAMVDRDIDRWQMQIGTDATLAQHADSGELIAGIAGHYGEADAAIRAVYGNGRIKSKGYGVSASLTWYGPQGFYTDAQAKFSWYDSDLKSDLLGKLANGNNGKGQAYSLEIGRRSPVGANLSLTPQIQMVYSKVDFDGFTDPNGAVVSLGLADSLRTRWGVSLDHQTLDERGRRTHLYGVANISYEWLDGTRVDVSGTPIANRNQRLWGELGVGGSYRLDDRFMFYTEVSANTALRDFGSSYSLKGTVGLRISF